MQTHRTTRKGRLMAAALALAVGLAYLLVGLRSDSASAPRDVASASAHGDSTQGSLPGQKHALRVCADPNNLPFSNDRLEGFEDQIAALVGRVLGRPLEYYWWAQRRGFFRNTVQAGACDVVMGVPADFDRLLTTAAYYRSTYAFVSRDDGPAISRFDDPRLRTLRIGIQLIGDDLSNPPPAHALGRRGIVENVVGYSIYGDYATDSPAADAVRGVLTHEVDLAIVWGPLAGYFALRASPALRITLVTSEDEGPERFTFSIAMGVRRGERALRDQLDEVIAKHRSEIDAILESYGVPRLALDHSVMDQVATRPADFEGEP
jgi:mxaJ protein